MWTIFHKIVVHSPSVCHVLDQRSYLQSHSAHMTKVLCTRHNSFLGSIFKSQGSDSQMRNESEFVNFDSRRCVGSGYFTQLSMIHECVITLSQGHVSNVKVTHSQHPSPGSNSLLRCLMWIIFTPLLYIGARVCHNLDQISHCICKVIVCNWPKSVWTITPFCHVEF